ncbi:Beta-fructofuranosidase, cell wall isozyme [Senna tora]|uniref:Beta-fructofuranosidase, cell wall isozyme n=1 Tax=Senna tora TaxID=362788 RepID=A0A834TRK0_9FABA|nr:Beta-fructofuranosidase, cell wall isozyme [Senna tora]
MRYKGVYHLFYQYNPKGADWGNIAWGHSVSKDLVNWTPLKLAIWPSEAYDIGGCWSGSATLILHNGSKLPAILYTGADANQRQTQNLVLPKNESDPFLREWVRSPHNPIISPTSFNEINATSFRDPTEAWLGHDGWWRVLVGSQRRETGIALLFRSKDLVDWIQAKHPLHSAKNTGMWECPDFFPVFINSTFGVETSRNNNNINGPLHHHHQLRHVLKVSLYETAHDYYLIGSYDVAKDKFIPDKGFQGRDVSSVLRYDYGKFYASKSFYDDAKKRRVLWGWVNESLAPEDYKLKGWSGIQGVPRSVWLHESGKQLVQWPIVEIEGLRGESIKWESKVVKGGSVLEVSGVTPAQADVEVSFEVNEFEMAEELESSSGVLDPQLMCGQKGASVKGALGPFGLLVLASKGLQEYTAVFFRVFRNRHNKYMVLMCSDQTRSSLNHKNDLTNYGAFVDVDPLHQNLSLRTLIDHSVVESFGGNGKACITARVYPTLAINDEAHLEMDFQRQTARHIRPDPEDSSLLYLEDRHISEAVWQQHPNRVFRPRRHRALELLNPPPPVQVMKLLQRTGFYGVARVGYIQYDHVLISALVERWRPETHSFHMPMGECSITLQDVVIQVGLSIDRWMVTGRTNYKWAELCVRLLGEAPPTDQFKGSWVMMSWFDERFSQVPENSTDVQLEQFTRGYIMRLLGGFLMPDTSGNLQTLMYLPLLENLDEVKNYSWGPTVLAYLYQSLCHATEYKEVVRLQGVIPLVDASTAFL